MMIRPLKIIALYKTFSGEEFIEASLESIYKHVDKIVLVNSTVSWSGLRGNTVAPIVEKWKNEFDIEKKIIQVFGEFRDQNLQYNTGIKLIRKILEYDYILLIDSDEVWDDENLERAFSILWKYRNISRFDCFTTRLFTYIKSPFYRIDPPERCTPTVFISNRVTKLDSARGWAMDPRKLLEGVFFHHFTLVRSNTKKIKNKIKDSAIGDGSGTNETQKIVENWFEEIWNKIPDVEDFHYQEKYKDWWKGIKRVSIDDLPPCLAKYLRKGVLK
jgi:hypothetical protein